VNVLLSAAETTAPIAMRRPISRVATAIHPLDQGLDNPSPQACGEPSPDPSEIGLHQEQDLANASDATCSGLDWSETARCTTSVTRRRLAGSDRVAVFYTVQY
jgi:hypothetical protein